MALVPETAFPGQIKPSSAAYPYGEAQNITTPGDGKGTPWRAVLASDLFGMQQSFLSAADITPNGQPDSVENSQYLDALNKLTDVAIWGDRYAGAFVSGFNYNSDADIARGQNGKYYRYVGEGAYPVAVAAGTVPGDFGSLYEITELPTTKKTKEFNSVADMVSGSPSKADVGDLCIVSDYYGDVSPNNSGVLFFKCVPDGTGTANGGKYIQGDGVQFEQNLKTPYCVRAWGARADNATDTKPAWDALTLYIRQNFAGAEIRFEGSYYFSDTPILYSAFVYQGGGKGVTSINLPAGKNGVKINPAPTNSVSYLEMRDFTIQASNTFPSAPKETGLKIDLTAACRRLNIRDVDIKGFTNGVDGKCPFYTCTFKNMDIQGIVPRDINDIQNYTNDNSFGFASGFNDNVGDVRDATTVTLENVFTGSFGAGIHNRYTSAMQLINCVSERNFYGLLADKGVYGTMYQEWNKESVKARGIHEPSGVNITAINSPGSWGTVTADTISTARASKFRTLSPTRGYQEYSDVTPVIISTATTYLDFNELNGEAITATSAPIHRILGLYEIEVSFSQNNDPTVQGTYIFDIWVKEDGEATYRNVKRSFLRVNGTDDFLGTLQFNYKGVTRGNQSNFRVSVSRVDGEAFTLTASSLKAIIREI